MKQLWKWYYFEVILKVLHKYHNNAILLFFLQ